MEQILPVLKSIFLNFDYYLIVIILVIWFFVKKRQNSLIAGKINQLAKLIYGWFIKLTQMKVWKLLLIFFLLNFVIRLVMAILVPEFSLNLGYIMPPHYLNLANSLFNGQGFTTHVIWNNFLQHPEIVRPDVFRVPFYPVLMASFFYIFGHSHFSAQLVNVLGGSLLPILAYGLAYVLTKSRKIATLFLLFISCNILILSWVPIISPEIIFCCGALLIMYFLYKSKDEKEGNFYALLVGFFLALTYLTRTEGLYVFLPVIVFYYFFYGDRKKFIIKVALTLLTLLVVASPYLIRNYLLTRNPFYSDFDRILMVAYIGHDYLIESPSVEYKNVYDIAWHHPWRTIKMAVNYVAEVVSVIPNLLIKSYVITFLCILGIWHVIKKDRQKYYFVFLAMLIGFLLPILVAGYTDRYFIFVIVMFYFFACLGIFKLYDTSFKKNPVTRSLLIIYVFVFLMWSSLVGISLGTLPNIPHSFYQRFDAQKYYSDLEMFYNYIKENTQPDDVIMASRHPYEVYYFTQRPTVIFPFTDYQGVQDFMKKYNVKWIIKAGHPIIVGDKFLIFWPDSQYPENIKPVFENTGGEFFKVEYYIQ